MRKPPSEAGSIASGKSGSSSGSDKSGSKSDASSAAEKGGELSPLPSHTISGRGSAMTSPRSNGHYPKHLHSSHSSVENHYPKSNASNPYG